MTTYRWFRLPETGDGSIDNPYRPDAKGYDVSWTGNKAHPDGAPHRVVRVYADGETLDALADEQGVKDLSSVPTQALNNMFGQNRDDDGWNRAFQIGQS